MVNLETVKELIIIHTTLYFWAHTFIEAWVQEQYIGVFHPNIMFLFCNLSVLANYDLFLI